MKSPCSICYQAADTNGVR